MVAILSSTGLLGRTEAVTQHVWIIASASIVEGEQEDVGSVENVLDRALSRDFCIYN